MNCHSEGGGGEGGGGEGGGGEGGGGEIDGGEGGGGVASVALEPFRGQATEAGLGSVALGWGCCL